MKKLNIKFLVLLLIVGLAFSTISVFASKYIDENLPESWYEAPYLSSELGLKAFEQSPMLDKRVENGELPPVAKRLPDDPPAIEPYKNIGKYGGTAILWKKGLNSFGSLLTYDSDLTHYGRITPDSRDVVPHLAKGWDFSDDFKVLTVYLREGVKWSDGHPFTADDAVYWWDHIANNSDMNPVSPELWEPPLLNVEKVDDYTFKIHYGRAVPNRKFGLAFQSQVFFGIDHPEHYMKQFHIDFRDKNELLKEVEEAGFEEWYEYYEYMSSKYHPDRTKRPSLNPFVAVERTENYLIAERNPYFPFVDTKGNQLPYIDKIRINLANSLEMQNMKMATGEANAGGRDTVITNYPLYKRNEEKSGIRTLVWYRPVGTSQQIQPNFTHDDPKMREIMHNDIFRKALSLSINREEINQKVYFGQAEPRQLTVPPMSKYYEPHYKKAYAEYKPERAKEMLDEIGMKDIDGDGFRELPDGEKFEPEFLYVEEWGPNTAVFEIVREHFREVGINIQLKLVGTSLFVSRKRANEFDLAYNIVNTITDAGFNTSYDTKAFSMKGWPPWAPWPLWSTWYQTNGEKGEEPPEKFKKLIQEPRDTMMYSISEEERIKAAKTLLEGQAENIWTIGTVGMDPKPVIVKDIYNIPGVGIWSNDTQRVNPYHPIQFYMDESK